MFQMLRSFDKILVTGAWRAGTRICAYMVAHDTGHRFVDEFEIGRGDPVLLRRLLDTEHKIAVHCPVFFPYIHDYSADDTAVVALWRDPYDVMGARRRIGWLAGNVGEVIHRYKEWNEEQKQKTKNVFEVKYEELAAHELWVSRTERRRMHWWRQDQMVPSAPRLLLVGEEGLRGNHLRPLIETLWGAGAHFLVARANESIQRIALELKIRYLYFAPGLTLQPGIKQWGGCPIVGNVDWKEAMQDDMVEMVITGDVGETLVRLARGDHPADMPGLAWRDIQGNPQAPLEET